MASKFAMSLSAIITVKLPLSVTLGMENLHLQPTIIICMHNCTYDIVLKSDNYIYLRNALAALNRL